MQDFIRKMNKIYKTSQIKICIMSKLKKFLKIATLGLAFSSYSHETQIQNNIPQLRSTSEITQKTAGDELREVGIETQIATSQTPRPKSSPLNVINNTPEEFLAYLRFIDQTRNIVPLKNEQIIELRVIAHQINSKNESSRTQDEKDLLMFYNRFRYQIDAPLIIKAISEILVDKNKSPNNFTKRNLQVIQERIEDRAFNTNREPETLQPLIFHPNETRQPLNSFLLTNLSNPSNISNGMITSIHSSYYRFLVGLLLIENNFGNTTTSNAGAQGSFQIKTDAQQLTRRGFNLTGRKAQDLEVLGFLHLFQLARIFGIDITKKPTDEEVILLSWVYFQGINSYFRLTDVNKDTTTFNRLRDYPYAILLIMQREDLFVIDQEIRQNRS